MLYATTDERYKRWTVNRSKLMKADKKVDEVPMPKRCQGFVDYLENALYLKGIIPSPNMSTQEKIDALLDVK
jgi:hypothetical protein